MDSARRPTEDALRGFLRERLPDYMVPAQVVVLDALPLLPNGKVDRGSLPAPSRVAGPEGGIAPRTPLEAQVAAVWREVLGIGRVGALDNFFELGGSSLLLVAVRARLAERVGRAVPLVELLRHPTVEQLARCLEGAGEAAAPPATAQPRERGALASARLQARRAAAPGHE